MTPSTFQPSKSPVSIRPSWLTHLAKLGRLCGEEVTLVGVIRDWHAESGETDFGLASASDISRIEGRLGSLDSVLDEGRTIEAWIRLEPRVVIDLKPLPVVERLPLRGSWNTPVTMLRGGGNNATLEQDFAELLSRAEADQLGFEGLRTKALARRARWSIDDMKSREDFPAWLPPWVCNLIREESRHWMTLPPQLPATNRKQPVTTTR